MGLRDSFLYPINLIPSENLLSGTVPEMNFYICSRPWFVGFEQSFSRVWVIFLSGQAIYHIITKVGPGHKKKILAGLFH